MVTSSFRIFYKCITDNINANINNNTNLSIDLAFQSMTSSFNFLFFSFQLKKALIFIEITFTLIENFDKFLYYFKCWPMLSSKKIQIKM